MSEPFPEHLSRFTPDVGGLNRDALLFAAGRASARSARGWPALTALLGVTQVATLLVLWPGPTPVVVQMPPPVALSAAPTLPAERPGFEPSEAPVSWSARHDFLEADLLDRPPPARAVTFIDSGPPLRAFGPPPASMLQ